MSTPQHDNDAPENQHRGVGLSDSARQQGMGQANAYDPGPSFAGDEYPSAQLSRMPAWLQTFAAMTGEPDEAEENRESTPDEAVDEPDVTAEETANDVAAGEPGPVVPESTDSVETEPEGADEVAGEHIEPAPAPETKPGIPDWLEQPRDQPASPPPSAAQYSSSSLISEDDLPEWLRAIEPEETPEPASPVQQSAESAAGVFKVPAVSRAWITGQEMRQLTEGASVFALVANQEPSTVLPGSQGATAGATAGQAPDRTGATAADVSRAAGQEDPQSGERGFRLMPVLLIVAAVILIVLLANFVLL